MNTRGIHIALAVAVATFTVDASAQFFRDVFRGLQFATTPIGPVFQTADGAIVNGARLGRIRFEENQFGDGWEVLIDRNFGPDSTGRPEIFDLGPLELELAGQTNTTLGFTRNGFLIGSLDQVFNNVGYRLAVTTGAADATVTGVLNIGNSIDINQFGFYEAVVNVSNDSSSLIVDTLDDDFTEELDFDIGPINVRGNIFLDGFVLLLNNLGFDTSGIEDLTGRSGIAELTRELEAAVQDAAFVAGEQLDFSDTLIADASFSVELDPAHFDSLGSDVDGSQLQVQAVPEAGTSGMLLVLTLLFLRRR